MKAKYCIIIGLLAGLVGLGLAAGQVTPPPTNVPTAPAIPNWTLSSESWFPATSPTTLNLSYQYVPTSQPAKSQPTSQPATLTATLTPVAFRVPQTQRVQSLNHIASQAISNLIVRGTVQNIVAQNYQGGLTVDNVVSVDSYNSAQFSGQGIYLDQIAGDVVIRNSYFGYDGNPRAPIGPQTPTEWRHGAYCNSRIGSLTVTGCVFADCANAGLQSRTLRGTTISGCVFLDCGTAILLIEGGATLTGNVIYGGNYYFDGTGWTGNTAIRSYWPISCNGNYLITRPNQITANTTPQHASAKSYPQAGLNLGGEWVHTDPVWTPPPGYPGISEYMSGSGNFISPDWPGGITLGPTKAPGWTVLPSPGPVLDYPPILAKIEAGGAVADGITAIRAALSVP